MEKREQLLKLAEKINRDNSITRIGIVGSRKYPDLEDISFFISLLREDLVLVSGGAMGVDLAAEKAFDNRVMKKKIHLPKKKPGMSYFELTNAFYARNKLIARDSDFVVAFVDSKKGGTWNTISWASRLHTPHEILEAF
jgi:predicted Rossmann fold nucleotide-binding protein DprA/Smf involved in DNA uptake